MHLIAETTFNGDVRDRDIFFGKKALGAINTAPHQILIGRESRGSLEQPSKVIWT